MANKLIHRQKWARSKVLTNHNHWREDTTVTASNREKAIQEIKQFKRPNELNLFEWLRTHTFILLSTLVVVISELISLWLWNGDRHNIDLSNANLSHAYLNEADLSRANLFSADLNHAYLNGANLSNANLFSANLFNADLWKADLSEVNLSRAYLSGADLSNANLSEANLFNADLSNTLQLHMFGSALS